MESKRSDDSQKLISKVNHTVWRIIFMEKGKIMYGHQGHVRPGSVRSSLRPVYLLNVIILMALLVTPGTVKLTSPYVTGYLFFIRCSFFYFVCFIIISDYTMNYSSVFPLDSITFWYQCTYQDLTDNWVLNMNIYVLFGN